MLELEVIEIITKDYERGGERVGANTNNDDITRGYN